MQRRRRGQYNNQVPIKNYEGTFNNAQNIPYSTQDDKTIIWDQNTEASYENDPDYAPFADSPTNEENQEYIYDEYDPENDEEYQNEIKRDRWKLIYFFINLCGTVIGLLLIFLLLAVIYNIIAWSKADILKIFGFIGSR